MHSRYSFGAKRGPCHFREEIDLQPFVIVICDNRSTILCSPLCQQIPAHITDSVG